MAKRPHPKRTTTNPHDGPWSACDRCGFLASMNRMAFQYDYLGGSVPQNLGLLVCETCTDALNFQQKLLILPPDPAPIFNTRPETYAVNETNWLTTESGDIITTDSGDPIITNIPNPGSVGNASVLTCRISAPGGSVAVAYLDLFIGAPSQGGASVLQSITGSATRTNIASALTTSGGVATNPDYIVITSASAAQTNLTYVGIYNAATGGTLLMEGAVGASPSIGLGNQVQFNQLGLSITL